jgi:hypothetical protein
VDKQWLSFGFGNILRRLKQGAKMVLDDRRADKIGFLNIPKSGKSLVNNHIDSEIIQLVFDLYFLH